MYLCNLLLSLQCNSAIECSYNMGMLVIICRKIKFWWANSEPTFIRLPCLHEHGHSWQLKLSNIFLLAVCSVQMDDDAEMALMGLTITIICPKFTHDAYGCCGIESQLQHWSHFISWSLTEQKSFKSCNNIHNTKCIDNYKSHVLIC